MYKCGKNKANQILLEVIKSKFTGYWNTLSSEVGLPIRWCTSFDLLYRSMTDFMLQEQIYIASGMGAVFYVNAF
jgi:hypothetical protein